MPDELRQSVVQKSFGKSLGTIKVVAPPSFRLVTAFVLTILVSFLAFVTFGTLARKVDLNGYVIPDVGITRVTPTTNGIVVSVLIREGDVVEEGQRLFAVRSDRTTESSQLVQQSILSQVKLRASSLRNDLDTQNRLFAQQEAGLLKRMETIDAELELLDKQISLQEQRLRMSKAALSRAEELAASNFVSAGAVDERRLSYVASEAELAAIYRSKSAMQRELASLMSERAELPLRKRSQLATLERSLASINQELAEAESRGQVFVTAPTSGKIGALAVTLGQSVSANTLMAIVYPVEGNLEVHLYATSKSIGFIKPGHQVYLRYEPFPHQKFGHQEGTIKTISSTPVQLSDLPFQITATANEPVFRVIVSMPSNTVLAYGQPQQLRPGTIVDASVALENRRVVEWLFEPILTMKGRLN